jgi:hypothetical protein
MEPDDAVKIAMKRLSDTLRSIQLPSSDGGSSSASPMPRPPLLARPGPLPVRRLSDCGGDGELVALPTFVYGGSGSRHLRLRESAAGDGDAVARATVRIFPDGCEICQVQSLKPDLYSHAGTAVTVSAAAARPGATPGQHAGRRLPRRSPLTAARRARRSRRSCTR